MSTAAEQEDISPGLSVEQRLARAWHKQRRFTWTRGACYLLLWVAVLFVIDVAVDWFFELPGSGRMALVAANAVALGWVIYRWWWRELRRFDAVRLALQVERYYPQLRSILVSYVQFHGGMVHGTTASPGLVRAMERQAVAETRRLNFRKIVSFRTLRRVFLAGVLVVAALAAAGSRAPRFFKIFFLRMSDPATDLTYPTRTQIESITGHRTVQQGSTVTIAATAAGVTPAEGVLHIQPSEGSWERLFVPRGEQPGKRREFAYRFDEIFRNFSYFYRIGDAKSEVYEVKVVPSPRIEPRVVLKYPEYTHLRPEERDGLSFEAPEGTEIEWRMKSDVPLAKAEMVREDRAVPVELSAGGKMATLKIAPRQSFFYHFRWTDDAHRFVYDEEVRYFVRIIPDKPPKVALLAPAQDEKATVQKTVDLVFEAEDDYGLADARIVFWVNSEEAQRAPIGEFEGLPREALGEAEWSLRESIPKLKVGDIIRYAVEVGDSRAGGQGRNLAESTRRRITIVSDSDYLAFMREKKKRLLGKIKGLHSEEKKAVDTVRELKKEGTEEEEKKEAD